MSILKNGTKEIVGECGYKYLVKLFGARCLRLNEWRVRSEVLGEVDFKIFRIAEGCGAKNK